MSERTSSYLPHVDGLRALAILSVVLFHAWPAMLPGGYAGVDVFFVISGFLITRLIAGEMEAGTFSMAGFLARRARRLVPAQIVLFAATLAAAYWLLWPEPFEDFANSLVAAALMFANIYFTQTTGYFDAPLEHRPLLHFWSLGVEDQFYLAWPLLLLAMLSRLGRARTMAPLAALAVVSLVAAELLIDRQRSFVFFNLPTRAFELLIGAGLALGSERISMSRAAAEALAAAGLLAIAASFALLAPQSRVPGVAILPACLGTAAVIAASARHSIAVSRILALRPIVFLGLISYSLYLWHWPLLVFQRIWLDRVPSWWEVAAAIAASAVIAALSWRFVERPFRGGQSGRWTAPQALATGAAVLGVVAFAGVAVRLGQGVPSRFSGPVREILDATRLGNPLRRSCDGLHLAFANDAVCNFGRRKADGESYEILVVGDSNADHFVPMVAKYATDKALAGRQITQSACAPVPGFARTDLGQSRREECVAYQRTLLAAIERNPGLKMIVVAGAWRPYRGTLRGNDVLAAMLPAAEALRLQNAGGDLEAALTVLSRHLTARGIKVHLVGQIPSSPTHSKKCVLEAVSSGTATERCALPLAQSRDPGRFADEAIKRVAARVHGVTATLPSAFLCSETSCPPFFAGTYLYRDWAHLNARAAVAILPQFQFPPLQ